MASTKRATKDSHSEKRGREPSAKAQREHGKIFQWVEAQDPHFAEAIRTLCMEGSLAPGPQAPGVTFVYPEDEKQRERICEAAAADDPEDAIRLVSALVIPDYLPEASDFRGRAGTLNGYAYEVEDASHGAVKLKGGAVLRRAADFRPRDGAAVWLHVSGELPADGPAYARPKRSAAAASAARAAPPENRRAALARRVEAEFEECLRRDGAREKDPYLCAVVSLLHFLELKRAEVLPSALAVLDWNPVVSFYLLLEPYKTRGAPLIPDDVLFSDKAWGEAATTNGSANGSAANGSAANGSANGSANGAHHHADAWDGSDYYEDAVAELRAFVERAAKILPKADALLKAVDAQRQACFQNQNKIHVPNRVLAAYKQLEGANEIGGVRNVYPSALHAHFKANPGKKLWQDEFRAVVHHHSAAVYAQRDRKDSARGGWRRVVEVVRDDRPGDDYAKEPRMIESLLMKGNVSPQAEYYELLGLVSSSDFLFVPVAADRIGEWTGAYDPREGNFYNRNYEAHRETSRGSSRRAGLSRAALGELRLYAARHGGDISALLRSVAPAKAEKAPTD